MNDLVTAGMVLTVGKALLGDTFKVMSKDIAQLYEKGRDKIIAVAVKRVPDVNDGRSTNLRVTRDVFWNGSFTDEDICAEYFGGILASARSDDGKDDSGVFYVDLIKSLSSRQLKLHYLIYLSLNKLLSSDSTKAGLNPGLASDLAQEALFLSHLDVLQIVGGNDLGPDLYALKSQGLVDGFKVDEHLLGDGKGKVPFFSVEPTPLGVQLYSVAHNKLDKWRFFVREDFGEFDSIQAPSLRAKTIEDLLTLAGIQDKDSKSPTP